jgi:hypothetical protein
MSGDLRQLALEHTIHDPIAFKPENLSKRESSAKRNELLRRYAAKLFILPALNRSLVSFQANKTTPFYRWFKYREGFSHELVRYFLQQYKPQASSRRRILDPFAGAGTTLTTATKEGWLATGVELLPVGVSAIRARVLADTVDVKRYRECMKRLEEFPLDSSTSKGYRFPHVRITEKAFTEETEQAISAYMAFLDTISDEDVRYLFWFACFSILEDVSFTRKDGQYLRWDNRSGRNLKAQFDKGKIQAFKPAVTAKLRVMLQDIGQRNGGTFSPNVKVLEGSCLSVLPTIPDASFDLVITSPPYCNRYDYTRTYALELAFLGYGEGGIKNLRQTLLSATVENKTKRCWLAEEYRARNQQSRFEAADEAFARQEALQEVLALLHAARERDELNNNNLPNLVENYFYEMCFVVHELARTLAPGGHVVMVNDNVQYVGEEVPVDLILSDFAASAGLTVDKIWVLPKGKGNSSQQMGVHGRTELRKCVHAWAKP